MTAYTDTELQEIAVWLRDGLSATRIAIRFAVLRGSPVSRNAIIGIVHRNTGLKTIGFANPKGGRSGGRPRKSAASKAAASKAAANENAASKTTVRKNPPVQSPTQGADVSKQAESVRRVATPTMQTRARSPAQPERSAPGRLVVDGEIYRIKLPAPRPAAIGRQPHVAAMRFIDCLFNRCRAPLDLTLEEDPENDAPGSRPGADMLCCGLRTRALKSYCAYHQARFCRPVAEVV